MVTWVATPPSLPSLPFFFLFRVRKKTTACNGPLLLSPYPSVPFFFLCGVIVSGGRNSEKSSITTFLSSPPPSPLRKKNNAQLPPPLLFLFSSFFPPASYPPSEDKESKPPPPFLTLLPCSFCSHGDQPGAATSCFLFFPLSLSSSSFPLPAVPPAEHLRGVAPFSPLSFFPPPSPPVPARTIETEADGGVSLFSPFFSSFLFSFPPNYTGFGTIEQTGMANFPLFPFPGFFFFPFPSPFLSASTDEARTNDAVRSVPAATAFPPLPLPSDLFFFFFSPLYSFAKNGIIIGHLAVQLPSSFFTFLPSPPSLPCVVALRVCSSYRVRARK